MQKKYIGMESVLRQLDADDFDSSMLLVMREDGERLYFHPFEDDLSALDYLETMVSAFRIDILERLMKRSVN